MDNEIYIEYRRSDYTIYVLVGQKGINIECDNVDVTVSFDDGRRYCGTFFTLKNIKAILDRYKSTGECANGTYLYAADMILVEALAEENIVMTVDDLVATGELGYAFQRLSDLDTVLID